MKKSSSLKILTFILVLLYLSAFGQKKTKKKEYLILDKEYSKAKIYKRDFKILNVTSLKLVNDTTVSYTIKTSQEIEQISINDVRYFAVKKGNKALPFGLYGAGVGALAVLLTVEKVETNSNWEYRDNIGLRIALMIGGCGAIGAGIGALTPKWKRRYIEDKKYSTTFILYPGIYKNYYTICLSIHF